MMNVVCHQCSRLCTDTNTYNGFKGGKHLILGPFYVLGHAKRSPPMSESIALFTNGTNLKGDNDILCWTIVQTICHWTNITKKTIRVTFTDLFWFICLMGEHLFVTDANTYHNEIETYTYSVTKSQSNYSHVDKTKQKNLDMLLSWNQNCHPQKVYEYQPQGDIRCKHIFFYFLLTSTHSTVGISTWRPLKCCIILYYVILVNIGS